MPSFKLAFLLAIISISACLADQDPRSYNSQPFNGHQSSEHDYDDAAYNFAWKVEDEYNNFGHQEEREGHNTQGSYYVALPDGRTQKVTYHVDGDSGYLAEVTYEGEARFPEESHEREFPRGGYN